MSAKISNMTGDVARAAHLLGVKASPEPVRALEDFLHKVNRLYPTDTVTKLDALQFIIGAAAVPTVEEYYAFKDLLPDFNYVLTVKLTAGPPARLKFSLSPKKTGAFYEVVFTGAQHGLDLPVNVTAIAYADMDDLDNHLDECPARTDPDDLCECETYEVRRAWFQIEAGDWPGKRDEFKDRIEKTILGVHDDTNDSSEPGRSDAPTAGAVPRPPV